jgi:hypothetical protein
MLTFTNWLVYVGNDFKLIKIPFGHSKSTSEIIKSYLLLFWDLLFNQNIEAKLTLQ